jgi:hypothetical protein
MAGIPKPGSTIRTPKFALGVINQFSTRSCVSDLSISDALIDRITTRSWKATRMILVKQRRKQPRESWSSVGIIENN